MPIARKHLIDEDVPGCYHLISRCVRRTHLCGKAYEHRRGWVRDLVRLAAASFAVEVFTHSIMSNHFHLVVHTDPHRVEHWSDHEVAERWCAMNPKRPHSEEPIPWKPEEIAAFAANNAWVARHRKRLASVSWFMKTIKERIAKRANREEKVTGHFWEGRFKSVHLLDQAAVVACMAYVDLNPVRAGMADRPEDSAYTGIKDRCDARQDHRTAEVLLAEAAQGRWIAPHLRQQAEKRCAQGPEAGLWIAPIGACAIDDRQARLQLDDYLQLVDQTGRALKEGKAGRIPPELRPLLERLDLDADAWLQEMRGSGFLLGAAIGSVAARAAEAARRGARWVVDTVAGLYRQPQAG